MLAASARHYSERVDISSSRQIDYDAAGTRENLNGFCLKDTRETPHFAAKRRRKPLCIISARH